MQASSSGGSTSLRDLPVALQSYVSTFSNRQSRRKLAAVDRQNRFIHHPSRPLILYEISERRLFTSRFPPTEIKSSGPYRVSSSRFDAKPDAEKVEAIFHILPQFTHLLSNQSDSFLQSLNLDEMRPDLAHFNLTPEDFLMLTIFLRNVYYNIISDVNRNGAEGVFRTVRGEKKNFILFTVNEFQDELARTTGRENFTLTKTLRSNWIDLMNLDNRSRPMSLDNGPFYPGAFDRNNLDDLLTRLPPYANNFILIGEQLDQVKFVLRRRFQNPEGQFDMEAFKQLFNFTVINEFSITKRRNPLALQFEAELDTV